MVDEKSNTNLYIGLAVGAVFLVVIVSVVLYFVFLDDEPKTPTPTTNTTGGTAEYKATTLTEEEMATMTADEIKLHGAVQSINEWDEKPIWIKYINPYGNDHRLSGARNDRNSNRQHVRTSGTNAKTEMKWKVKVLQDNVVQLYFVGDKGKTNYLGYRLENARNGDHGGVDRTHDADDKGTHWIVWPDVDQDGNYSSDKYSIRNIGHENDWVYLGREGIGDKQDDVYRQSTTGPEYKWTFQDR